MRRSGATAGPLLRTVTLFDIYRGRPLGETEKSLAYRLAFGADERTLVESEVDAAVADITAGLRDATSGVATRGRSGLARKYRSARPPGPVATPKKPLLPLRGFAPGSPARTLTQGGSVDLGDPRRRPARRLADHHLLPRLLRPGLRPGHDPAPDRVGVDPVLVPAGGEPRRPARRVPRARTGPTRTRSTAT